MALETNKQKQLWFVMLLLVMGFTISLAISIKTVIAPSSYIKTKIIFNLLSNPEFVVQVNNNTWANSQNTTSNSSWDSAETIQLSFVTYTGNESCVYPNSDYNTNPTFRFYNTGNEDLNFTMKIDEITSLSSNCNISIYYDDDAVCKNGGEVMINPSWSNNLFSLSYNASPKDVWLYADISNCLSSDSGSHTYLYTNGTII